MNGKMITRVIGLALAILPLSVSADEDLRALVKALSAQVAELNNQVKQSNQRVAELERKLQQVEKDKQPPAPPRQASIATHGSTPPPATAAPGTGTAGTTSKDAKCERPPK